MKIRILIGLIVMASLLTACVYPLEPRPEDGPQLGLVVEFPEKMGTKAEVGPMYGSDAENSLHSLKVWVFRSDNHEKVTAREIAEEDFPVGERTRRYSFPVPLEFAEYVREGGKVDVFVLANENSLGMKRLVDAEWVDLNLNEDSSWDDLRGATFGDDAEGEVTPYRGFGLDYPVKEVIEQYGLPFSGVGLNLDVQGEAPDLRVNAIQIKRMVSRIRFIFCKTTVPQGGVDKSVAIQDVFLNAYKIPYRTYLFADQKTGIYIPEGSDYPDYIPTGYAFPWPAGKELVENVAPENYLYVNQSPSDYEQLLNNAVINGELSDMGYVYLRESDIPLSGRINYTVDGELKSRDFQMSAKGDFARNHTWTVYGYFVSGRFLQLSLRVLPWDYNKYSLDFKADALWVDSPFWVDPKTAADYIETSNKHYDVKLYGNSPVKGHITILSPVNGTLFIRPIGDTPYFDVYPEQAAIDATNNGGRIDITISRKDSESMPEDWEVGRKAITLSFSVKTIDGREIDANSEGVDQIFSFIL